MTELDFERLLMAQNIKTRIREHEDILRYLREDSIFLSDVFLRSMDIRGVEVLAEVSESLNTEKFRQELKQFVTNYVENELGFLKRQFAEL